MIKIILALISWLLIFRAFAMRDISLVCYWALVFVYWIVNYVEGIK